MTLKQLQAFYWAATCPSFAAAAAHLHVTVSSLSTRLSELERSLGQALFDRSGHKAALTPAGERLLPLAADLLARADTLRQQMAPQPGLQGPCRIGTGELASLTWLPRWVQQLRQAHPGLRLAVTVDIGAHLAQQLDQAELDVALIAGPARHPSLASQPVGRASFVLCAHPARARHWPTGDAAALAQAVSTSTLVCLPRGSGVTQVLDHWLTRLGTQPRELLSCNQWGATAQLVAQDAGLGLLPLGLATALERQGQLQRLPTPWPLPQLDYSLQWRHQDPRPLIALLRQSCTGVVDFDGLAGG